MKPVRCLCHVVLLPQEGNNVNCDQALFFFLERKSRRTPYQEQGEEGRVIAWGTHNSASSHAQSLFFNSIRLFF